MVVQALVLAGVLAARVAGDDPRSPMDDVPNFRMVDDRLWAGGQPEAEAYRVLAERGVRLVVDLRTGAADDPRKDDPKLLESLGVAYVWLPIADGHVPSTNQVARFARLVEGAPGPVYVHCGGGVGRTSALTAAFARRSGDELPFADLVAIGPHTLDQLWFLATGDSNVVVRRASELVDAPRRAWSRFRGLF
ncbi:MAG TPA: sulfur transferase domain-containing protein [Acidimicrobiales bacterium]|nr:sulfur transferase domain-containing protein [Acidimicrobiales bacterium]